MSVLMEEPKSRTFTPEDLLQLPGHGKGFELVHGELKELDLSFLSSFVAVEVHGALRDHVRPRRLGWVSPEGTSFRCFPDPKTIRRADAAFHLLSRVSSEQAQSEGFMSIVPDIVVVVVSPNDLSYEVEEKRIDWMDAGAKLVWIIYPEQKTIHVWLANGDMRSLKRTETLTAEPVLPDFRVPVSELFQLPSDPIPTT